MIGSLVADELAAAVGEVCTVLLAVAGREPPDVTPLRHDAPADQGAAGPNRLTRIKRSCWGKKGSARRGIRWNGNFGQLHIDTSPPQGLLSWKLMRRRTIWFIGKGFGCIRVVCTKNL